MMPHTADGAARDDRVSSATAPCAASEGTPALPLTVVSPLHGLPDARLVSSRVEGTGEVHRVLFSAGAAYELLRTIRDAQYGTIKAAVPLRALPDGTFARTADSAVVKVFYKKLYRANWGRLSKSHISEDARSELTTWAHLSTGEGHINVARLMDVCQDKVRAWAGRRRPPARRADSAPRRALPGSPQPPPRRDAPPRPPLRSRVTRPRPTCSR